MNFDPENRIVQLCAKGMDLEGHGQMAEASELFYQAWDAAVNDLEKFIAAHYVARHQKDVRSKLQWDEVALNLALEIDTEESRRAYSSLYLNIAKCHEDLKDVAKARKYYELAYSFTHLLSDDGYGNLIRRGILNGLDRVKAE